ncbi:MAG: hypothetical protein JOY95_01120 [Silvibacterium sp.]|nr:hypothetical protein [Silvibacterium sp.]
MSDTALTVPFIGCPADGQAGPLDAPKRSSKVVHIPKEAAQQLAFYKAEQGFGVLAPRGWYCFETYGSNGGSLFVSPQPIDGNMLFSDTWKGFTGPVIQMSAEGGGTSGRFGVARIIARVFPSHRAFVRKVISEGIEPASDFPSGPYPKDKLVYKSKELVEYQTPAQTEGLGTQSRLVKNADPIRGVAILVGLVGDGEPSLVFFASRLPSEMTNFTSAIIQQTEYDAAHSEADQ